VPNSQRQRRGDEYGLQGRTAALNSGLKGTPTSGLLTGIRRLDPMLRSLGSSPLKAAHHTAIRRISFRSSCVELCGGAAAGSELSRPLQLVGIWPGWGETPTRTRRISEGCQSTRQVDVDFCSLPKYFLSGPGAGLRGCYLRMASKFDNLDRTRESVLGGLGFLSCHFISCSTCR